MVFGGAFIGLCVSNAYPYKVGPVPYKVKMKEPRESRNNLARDFATETLAARTFHPGQYGTDR
jgi:hypothetical protein